MSKIRANRKRHTFLKIKFAPFRFLKSQPLPIQKFFVGGETPAPPPTEEEVGGRSKRAAEEEEEGEEGENEVAAAEEEESQDESPFDCDWNIRTDPELYLLVTFHNLSAPTTVKCRGAYIEVEREGNGFEARWCGNRLTTVAHKNLFLKSVKNKFVIFRAGVVPTSSSLAAKLGYPSLTTVTQESRCRRDSLRMLKVTSYFYPTLSSKPPSN